MDRYEDDTWISSIIHILDTHRVRKPVGQVLLWEFPLTTATYFLSGLLLYVIVQVVGIGFLTVIGLIAIMQLAVYRTASFMQKREFRIPGTSRPVIQAHVDLKQTIVLTPSASTVSTSIEILGDLIRTIEEEIKELSLSRNYFAMLRGFSILMFLSLLGKFITLPALLLVFWILAYTLPVVYFRFQDPIDEAIETVQNAFRKQTGKAKEE